MPWKETCPVNQRLRFIAAYQTNDECFSSLCDHFGVSRKTGYKWLDRYEQEGPSALEDRSSAPLSHPHAVSSLLSERIVAIRKKHPRWGPKKIRVILGREHDLKTRSGLILPATSTIGEILKRHGLSARKKRIRRSVPYSKPLGGYDFPNAIWCADFKGSFLVQSGIRCNPLTISDGYSRKVLRCTGLRSSVSRCARKVFESAFREFGLPDTIRTDNGAPFSTLAAGGLSHLAIWWIRLGIRPERIEPGRPDQNGRHERMHRTLKAETAKPPRENMLAQQRAFDSFLKDYNEVRPHEAIGMRTPESLYKPSLVPYPEGRLPDLEYPKTFRIQKVYPNGIITFGSTQWAISTCLVRQKVGLEEVDNDQWKVHFGPIPLGIIDLRIKTKRTDRQFGKMSPLEEHSIHRRKLYRK